MGHVFFLILLWICTDKDHIHSQRKFYCGNHTIVPGSMNDCYIVVIKPQSIWVCESYKYTNNDIDIYENNAQQISYGTWYTCSHILYAVKWCYMMMNVLQIPQNRLTVKQEGLWMNSDSNPCSIYVSVWLLMCYIWINYNSIWQQIWRKAYRIFAGWVSKMS